MKFLSTFRSQRSYELSFKLMSATSNVLFILFIYRVNIYFNLYIWLICNKYSVIFKITMKVNSRHTCDRIQRIKSQSQITKIIQSPSLTKVLIFNYITQHNGHNHSASEGCFCNDDLVTSHILWLNHAASI
jgi:hypothetical protein